jgi:hypothetical protein
MILRLHEATTHILALIANADADAERLMGVDGREIALELDLHVLWVRIAYRY